MKKITLAAITLCVAAVVANAAPIDIIGDYTTDKGPNFVGPNSALGNGDFQAQTGALAFSAVDNWFNVFGAETVGFGKDNGTVGSPQSGSQGAQLNVGGYAANNTGYNITAAGEAFNVAFYLGSFGSPANYGVDEVAYAHLFTLDSGVVDADTTVADMNILGSASFAIEGGFFNMVRADGFYTSVPADVGDTVYLALELQNPTGNIVYPRIDVVSLSVVPEPATIGLLGISGAAMLFIRRKFKV